MDDGFGEEISMSLFCGEDAADEVEAVVLIDGVTALVARTDFRYFSSLDSDCLAINAGLVTFLDVVGLSLLFKGVALVPLDLGFVGFT